MLYVLLSGVYGRAHLFLLIISFTLGLTNTESLAVTVTFTVFNVPNSLHTYALGINNKSQVVGYYCNDSGTYGFSLVGGGLNTIDVAGVPPRRRAPQGNFDTGMSMGLRWEDGGFQYFRFGNENFSLLGSPSMPMSRVHGISNNGMLVGRSGPPQLLRRREQLPYVQRTRNLLDLRRRNQQ